VNIRLRGVARGNTAVGHSIAVLDAERAGRLLRQGVAVPLSVRSPDKGGDDLETPVGDVHRLAPEIRKAKVDVELEKIDTSRRRGHPFERTDRTGRTYPQAPASRPRRSFYPSSRYESSARTVKGSVQSTCESPSIVRRHS